jgi:hydroxymethylbilane synthase
VAGEARFSIGDMDAPAKLAADLLARATPAVSAHFAGSR